MAVGDAESAEGSVREWILRKFGTAGEGVYFESVRRDQGAWLVDVQFVISGYRKYYSVAVDASSGSVTGYSERFRPFNLPGYVPSPRGTAGMLMLAALIVSIIVVIIFISSGISNLAGGIFTLYYNALGGAGRIILGVVLIAFGLIDIYLTVEINNIREALEKGDIRSALSRNNLAFGVIAIIFDGVVTGILLIVAREEMRRLGTESAAQRSAPPQ